VLLKGALSTLAKSALISVISPFIEEAKDTALNAVQDSIRSTVAGKMSIDEWASVLIESIDHVKEHALNEENLRYIGGELKFIISERKKNSVETSFQLYFLDESQKWHKAEADSDIPFSKFIQNDLNQLMSSGEIAYEVK